MGYPLGTTMNILNMRIFNSFLFVSGFLLLGLTVHSQTMECVDTVAPGLHIYKREVSGKDDIAMLSIRRFGYRRRWNPDNFVYNIGSSPSNLWFSQWQNDIYAESDQYEGTRNYVVVYDSAHYIYDLKNKKIIDDFSFFEPKLWRGNLIVSKKDSLSTKGMSTYYLYNISTRELRYVLPNGWLDYYPNKISLNSTFVNNSYDMLDTNLRSVVPEGFVYEGQGRVHGDIIVCRNKQTKLAGLFSLNKKLLIPDKFDHILPLETSGIIEAIDNKVFGSYTNVAIPDSFLNYGWRLKYIEARRGDSAYFFNNQFKLLIKEKYVGFHVFQNYIALVDDFDKHPHKEGVFDTSGNIIIPVRDWKVNQFVNDVYLKVEEYGYPSKVGYYSTKSKREIIPFSERQVDYIGFDLFTEKKQIKRTWKYCFVDTNNTYITDLTYDDIGSFAYGYCLVQRGREFSFLDPRLTVVYTIKADYVSPFLNGEAEIQIGNKTYWINNKFEKVR